MKFEAEIRVDIANMGICIWSDVMPHILFCKTAFGPILALSQCMQPHVSHSIGNLQTSIFAFDKTTNIDLFYWQNIDCCV